MIHNRRSRLSGIPRLPGVWDSISATGMRLDSPVLFAGATAGWALSRLLMGPEESLLHQCLEQRTGGGYILDVILCDHFSMHVGKDTKSRVNATPPIIARSRLVAESSWGPACPSS